MDYACNHAIDYSTDDGAGTGLIRGSATPDWRVYGGVNIAIGPLVQRAAARRSAAKANERSDG